MGEIVDIHADKGYMDVKDKHCTQNQADYTCSGGSWFFATPTCVASVELQDVIFVAKKAIVHKRGQAFRRGASVACGTNAGVQSVACCIIRCSSELPGTREGFIVRKKLG